MEDPEVKILLKENLELAEDNNKMLRRLYRSSQWALIFSIIKWVIIIGATIGLFYYFKPVIDSMANSYQYLTGHQIPDLSNFFKK